MVVRHDFLAAPGTPSTLHEKFHSVFFKSSLRMPLKLYIGSYSSYLPSCRYSYTDAFTPPAGPTHVVKNYTVKRWQSQIDFRERTMYKEIGSGGSKEIDAPRPNN